MKNEKPAMVLVGLGANEKTTRMVFFLIESGLDSFRPPEVEEIMHSGKTGK